MNKIWEDVISLFDEIADEYVSMSDLAEEKRQALIVVDVKKVNDIIASEETLIKRIGALEIKRQDMVEQLAKEGGWDDKKIKLLDIVERAPKEYAERMKKVGQRLADIIMRIALLNGVNNNLLKQAMSIIEYNINILSCAQATPFYSEGGDQMQNGRGNMGLSVLDKKA